MPNRPTDPYWVMRVRAIGEQSPRLGPAKIGQALQAEARLLGRTDYPSGRTISRILDAHRKAPEGDRELYRLVYWPESFKQGALTWDVAGVVMELLRLYRPDETGNRPLVQMALWYCKVTQVAPEAPDVERRDAAGILAATEHLYGDVPSEIARCVEAYLTLRAWEPSGWERYHLAIKEGRLPSVGFDQSGMPRLRIPEEAEMETAVAAYAMYSGLSLVRARGIVAPIRGLDSLVRATLSPSESNGELGQTGNDAEKGEKTDG